MRRTGVTLIAVAATVAAVALVFVGTASAVNFGVGVLKDCATPMNVGDPYSCEVEIDNLSQASHASVRVTSLTDVVFAAGGSQTQVYPINSSSFSGQGGLILTGGAACDATGCTVPFGGTLTTPFFSHYAAQVADFPQLNDQATYTWNEICATSIVSGCSSATNNSQATASAAINPIPTTTTTSINSGGVGGVSAVAAGSSVTDSVTVANTIQNQPPPTGNVTVSFYGTIDCSGNPLDAASTDPLDGNGQALNVHPEGPLAAGLYSYQAVYPGSSDGAYTGSTGACEPLRVVDANIQLTPATATNATGTNHTLTCHVNTNDGSGLVNAADGTVCTVAIISGPGTPVSQNCTTSGGTGSCQVTITSATPGTSVLQASTNVSVSGVVLHRQTGDTNAGDGPNAQKVWVDANIQISPLTATNATGTNHVLTITVNALGGTIDAGPHTATATIVSGPGSFVGGVNTCTYTGGAATASCTVTITSNTTGTTVVSATSNIPVNGQTISRTTATNPGPGGSGNASKVWVDANIQISPSTATNPIGTNHVLTITVNALGGTLDAGPHTATASIVSGPGSFVGSPTCTYTGGGASASCQVTITSNTPGTTVVSATANIPVNGQTITRTTGTAANTASGGSGNASKLWLAPDANIQISPQTASDPTGDNHTLTAHVNVSSDSTTYTAAPDGTVITFSLSNAGGATATFVGPSTCTTSGGTGSCSVTISSPTGGTTTIHATTTVIVNGVSLTRSTGDSLTGDSPDATKTWIPPGGIIAPTQTSCSDVLNNTFATLGQINYSLSGGVIGQGINPGVFFYYAKITTTTPNQVVTVTQSNTSTNNTPLFSALNGQAWLWKGDCSSHTTGALIANGSGASFTVPTPGNYIIGIKYSTKSIAGAPAPIPATITYNFVSSLGASTAASVLLKKQ